jgi:hypothetical protein
MISTDKLKIVPMDSLESLERLISAIHDYHIDEFSPEIINKTIYDTFFCGYEAWIDGVAVGWSYASCIDGVFTLDGYNTTKHIFIASKMGKAICNYLFNRKNVGVIFTMHKTNLRPVTVLAKRIGFRTLMNVGDKTLFYKVKSWVSKQQQS